MSDFDFDCYPRDKIAKILSDMRGHADKVNTEMERLNGLIEYVQKVEEHVTARQKTLDKDGSDRIQHYMSEAIRLRGRVFLLEKLARESLEILTCIDEDDSPGHRCSHCDDYVDRNQTHRNALRAALGETKL